jgi:probable F420-dependent oxidoreductase
VKISVAPALWPGDTVPDVSRVTRLADQADVREVWYSEVNGYDALALSAAMASSGATGTMAITVGPVPLGVRDPALLAMGLATVAAVANGRVGVALGTSTPTIVESWHGREIGAPVRAMSDFVPTLREAAAGLRLSGRTGVNWSSDGFKLSVAGVDPLDVTIAALGKGMVRFAGQNADRVVVNLVTPEQIPGFQSWLGDSADTGPSPTLASWLMTGSRNHALERAASLLRPYATAPGYSGVLAESGLAELILTAPETAAEQVGAFGSASLRDRLEAFAETGVDEIVLVVSGADPDARELIETAKSLEVKS